MTLKQWEEVRWLKPHETSAEEIANLMAIFQRGLKDAENTDISADLRFSAAYNAALKLCTVLLYASGYRPVEKNRAHYIVIRAVPFILGDKHKGDTNYLDACRNKRNTVEYDYVGGATEADAEELVEFSRELEKDVLAWLKKEHPDLMK